MRTMWVGLVAAWLMISCIAAAGPWVPIGNERHQETLNLVGSSEVAFDFIRGHVNPNTDLDNVSAYKGYGAIGTKKKLAAMSDDWEPIGLSSYAWQEISPIYYNPHMDFYWGYRMISEDGSLWYELNPKKWSQWNNSWDNVDNSRLMQRDWANVDVPLPGSVGEE